MDVLKEYDETWKIRKQVILGRLVYLNNIFFNFRSFSVIYVPNENSGLCPLKPPETLYKRNYKTTKWTYSKNTMKLGKSHAC